MMQPSYFMFQTTFPLDDTIKEKGEISCSNAKRNITLS